MAVEEAESRHRASRIGGHFYRRGVFIEKSRLRRLLDALQDITPRRGKIAVARLRAGEQGKKKSSDEGRAETRAPFRFSCVQTHRSSAFCARAVNFM